MTNDYEALDRALGRGASPDPSSLGQLLSVRLTVEPRLLESTLEALAKADFPINPQLTHQRKTLIEFPAYRGQLKQLSALLTGLPVEVSARNMLDEIRAPGESPVLAH
ncbi:MAG: hypothetical protein K2X03_15110 [Bryobacteraceae bacterium]|nr:hypothetical protein [Bryobacteraceae bacterium]